MKLPVQQIQKDAAKCLILLGSRGQKTGKTVFGVELGRYGSKVVDIAKGKNSVEVANGTELIAVLETLKSACELGELDQQISGAADAVRARFAK